VRRPGKGEGKAKTTKPAQVVAKKPAVTEVRAKVLIADLRKERATLVDLARAYEAVMNETDWKAAEIARRMEPASRAAMGAAGTR
jgi:hypothetical protein